MLGWKQFTNMWGSTFLMSLMVFSLSELAFGQYDPHVSGGRSVYVHLFEWKWTDIAAECERFLGPKGFGGIQVSPPNEHRVIGEPFRPWYERYQSVSYKLQSRSGNEAQFTDMVKRCNNAGVRIYVDAVINHMAGGSGTGTAGSSYNADTLQYPGVPFGLNDFTGRSECPSSDGGISNYQNAAEVRNCRLLGLPDLGIYKDWTKAKIQEYLNKLIGIGVAGFRVDASKHMWPAHLEALFAGLNNLNTTYFPAGKRAFVFHEVIDLGGESIPGREYLGSGRVTEFKYGKYLSEGIRKENGQMLRYYRNFGEEWGFMPGMQIVTFIDNHDNQRGHGGGGSILTFREPRLYKLANAFMLAHPYGFPQVMSSYDWPRSFQNGEDKNNWIGPPSDSSGNTNTVPIAANGACDGGWKCEHRWRQIANMVGFRNTAGTGGLVHWYDNFANQVGFGRGTEGNTRAFIAINNDNFHFGRDLMTGLPPGTYCDVISGNLENGRCTGKSIVVGATRSARIDTSDQDEDPMIAIHVNAKL